MASEQTTLNVMGNALWDPHPTQTDLRARQLAVALGYPLEWRVVRTIETMEIPLVRVNNMNENDDDDTRMDDDDDENKPTTSSTTATYDEKGTTTKVETALTAAAVAAPAVAAETPAAAAVEAPSKMVVSSSTRVETEVTTTKSPDTVAETATVAVTTAAPVGTVPTDQAATTSVTESASATVTEPPKVATAAADTAEIASATGAASMPKVAAAAPPSPPTPTTAEASVTEKAPQAISEAEAVIKNEANEAKPAAKAAPTSETESALPVQTKLDPAKSLDKAKSSDISNRNKDKKQIVSVIVDRIYAGKPGTGCDMWVHHEAAMQAAQAWIIHGKQEEDDDENAASKGPTPFDHKGGHLLPRLPRFSKGDKVQVLYEDEWWDAKILRRREHAEAGFRYQVQYIADHSKQSGVEEDLIRPVKADTDALAAAASIGLVEGGWKAYVDGHHKWKIEAPDGTVYRSKKAALEAYAQLYKLPQEEELVEEGDPPWRTTGHDYLGRHVEFVQHHQVSARRSVRVEQIGTVTGWISESDVDKAGEPGFVSEKTGAPAALFHVVFPDEPNHPYSSMLVQSQDLEEYELLECLLNEEEYRPPKKARKR